jgi:hypothetical protein
MGTTSGKYTSSVTIQIGANSTNPTLTLRATIMNTGVNLNIAGKSMDLETTDGGGTWRCFASGANPVSAELVPSACR